MSKIKYLILNLSIISTLFILSFRPSFSSSGTFYQISQLEADELSKLYVATGGDNWTENFGWSATMTNILTPTILSNDSGTFIQKPLYGVGLGVGDIVSSDESSTIYSASINIIVLFQNSVSGTLPNLNLPNLETFSLIRTSVYGEIPDFDMPKLKQLYFSENGFSGEIPNFNLPKLEQLSLNKNNLSGEVPNFNLSNLEDLTLSDNQLSGEIPNFNLPKLKGLGLHENNLSGSIPNFNMPDLIDLSLGRNQLSGEIPNFNLPKLEQLRLNENNLSGDIPNFDLPNLKRLDLIRNELSGKIPNFDLPELDYIALSFNKLSGDIPEFNLPKLEIMYLSYNELSGSIPNFNMPNLTTLNLIVNQLNGEIPNFENLPKIEGIGLSKNKLSGEIPDFDLPALIGIGLDSNRFTFEALETNIDKYKIYFYAGQDTILPIEQIDNKIKVTVDGSSNTYTWFLDKDSVSSGISKTYRPRETGIYHCEVTNSLLPDLTLSSHTINVLTVGITTEEEDRNLYYLYNFPPYPQPASSEVKIPIYWRLGNPVNPDNIKIYNNMGVEIKQENKIKIEESTSINGEVIWDASGVDSGIYFLEIRHGTSLRYVKIMME
jgi:uncharacterized protein YjbI with pentapeptide repeats